jgi:hypothetical protein
LIQIKKSRKSTAQFCIKTTAMKRKITYTILVWMLFLGCRKEQQQTDPQVKQATGLTLAQVKAFYKTDTASHIYWDQATYVTGKKVPYWLVAIDGRPKFQNLGLGYRKLAFYLGTANMISSRILEIIPDALYLQRKGHVSDDDFTGRIFTYDQDYHLLYGKTYQNGKQTGQIKPVVNGEKPVKTDKLEPVTECAWVAENYVDADGNAVIYSEQVCGTSYFDLGGSGGFDDSAGGGDPFNTQPDLPPVKGAGIPPVAPPEVSNLPGENKGGINPKDYMSCFQNIPDNGATMKITIYVQEPWPGTSFNIGPNSVGHTAIGLTKTNGSTSITQTVGFYPDASGFDKAHAPSKIVDNGGDLEYNASISYTVTAENFNKIVNYISNPPATYDITDFNCTNFVNSACIAGSINLPNPITYSPLYPQSPV